MDQKRLIQLLITSHDSTVNAEGTDFLWSESDSKELDGLIDMYIELNEGVDFNVR